VEATANESVHLWDARRAHGRGFQCVRQLDIICAVHNINNSIS
jgi:hypothetical protein